MPPIQIPLHYHERTRLACVMHSGPQKQKDIKQNRTRGQDLSDWKTRPFLHFAAQNSFAPSSLCQYFTVCVYACAQCMQRALSRWLVWQLEHVRWWTHRDLHSSICRVSSPNQPNWGMLPVVITNMASSCLWNICSTLLNSLACLHRKWRTKWLKSSLPPPSDHTIASCAMCVCVCLLYFF